jgi:hypothetical protein
MLASVNNCKLREILLQINHQSGRQTNLRNHTSKTAVLWHACNLSGAGCSATYRLACRARQTHSTTRRYPWLCIEMNVINAHNLSFIINTAYWTTTTYHCTAKPFERATGSIPKGGSIHLQSMAAESASVVQENIRSNTLLSLSTTVGPLKFPGLTVAAETYLGNALQLILLLDGERVRGTLGCIDELVRETLRDCLDVAEGSFPGTSSDQVNCLHTNDRHNNVQCIINQNASHVSADDNWQCTE